MFPEGSSCGQWKFCPTTCLKLVDWREVGWCEWCFQKGVAVANENFEFWQTCLKVVDWREVCWSEWSLQMGVAVADVNFVWPVFQGFFTEGKLAEQRQSINWTMWDYFLDKKNLKNRGKFQNWSKVKTWLSLWLLGGLYAGTWMIKVTTMFWNCCLSW